MKRILHLRYLIKLVTLVFKLFKNKKSFSLSSILKEFSFEFVQVLKIEKMQAMTMGFILLVENDMNILKMKRIFTLELCRISIILCRYSVYTVSLQKQRFYISLFFINSHHHTISFNWEIIILQLFTLFQLRFLSKFFFHLFPFMIQL